MNLVAAARSQKERADGVEAEQKIDGDAECECVHAGGETCVSTIRKADVVLQTRAGC